MTKNIVVIEDGEAEVVEGDVEVIIMPNDIGSSSREQAQTQLKIAEDNNLDSRIINKLREEYEYACELDGVEA